MSTGASALAALAYGDEFRHWTWVRSELELSDREADTASGGCTVEAASPITGVQIAICFPTILTAWFALRNPRPTTTICSGHKYSMLAGATSVVLGV